MTEIEGLVKLDVRPPTNLFHPVLPRRINGKVIFVRDKNMEDCYYPDDKRIKTDEINLAWRKLYFTKSGSSKLYSRTPLPRTVVCLESTSTDFSRSNRKRQAGLHKFARRGRKTSIWKITGKRKQCDCTRQV